MGCDYRTPRLFRILIRETPSATYYNGGGDQPIEAGSHRAALDLYCASAGWQPPSLGDSYEYAVVNMETYTTETFIVKPTPGYTIATN